VIVTKVRTGDITEELVVVEDSVDDEVKTTNVAGAEKGFAEVSAAVEVVVLVVDMGVDEDVTTVGLESLGVVDEAAAAPVVGFGWFFPGIGLSTVIAEVGEARSELSGVARGIIAGVVNNRGSSTNMGSQCISHLYLVHRGPTLVHSGNSYQ
jgi:hypothetical protein